MKIFVAPCIEPILFLITSYFGKEKPKPRMGSGDNGMNVGKGDGSILAKAAERWGQVEARVQKNCMRGHRAEMPLLLPARGYLHIAGSHQEAGTKMTKAILFFHLYCWDRS